jgi:hypothetical protein
MTDSTDNARGPKRITAWGDMTHHGVVYGAGPRPMAVVKPFKPTEYIRADLAPDPLADARVQALVGALKVYADSCEATETTPCGYEGNMCCMTARAALAAFGKGGKDE